jgi:hypothetical protein
LFVAISASFVVSKGKEAKPIVEEPRPQLPEATPEEIAELESIWKKPAKK